MNSTDEPNSLLHKGGSDGTGMIFGSITFLRTRCSSSKSEIIFLFLHKEEVEDINKEEQQEGEDDILPWVIVIMVHAFG